MALLINRFKYDTKKICSIKIRRVNDLSIYRIQGWAKLRVCSSPIFCKIAFCFGGNQFELRAVKIFVHVNFVTHALNINLFFGICPAAKPKLTKLIIEWEESYINVASTPDYCWCIPFVFAIRRKDYFCLIFVHCSRIMSLLGTENRRGMLNLI